MTIEPEQDKVQVIAGRAVIQRYFHDASTKLRSNPVLTKTIYGLCALGIALQPFLWASGIIQMNQHSRVYPYYSYILWLTILAVTLLHELNAPWRIQLNSAMRSFAKIIRYSLSLKDFDDANYSPESDISNLKTFGRSLANNRFTTRVLAFSAAVWLVTALETSIIHSYRNISTLWSLLFCAGISVIFPSISVATLWLSRSLTRKQALSNPSKTQNEITRSLNSFLTSKGPYLGAYAGFISLIGSICFSELGLGTAYWLYASLLDANIAPSNSGPESIYVYLCSALIAIVLYLALSPLVIRLSSSFQILVNRIFVAGDNLLDALIDTANLKSTSIHLTDHNVAIRNITSALGWLSTCYAALFFLVAFCPDPLGNTILNWLHASCIDARLNIDPHQHANFKLFLASIIAAYGAVPVAVMTCSFLPPRQARTLIVSEQGILFPDSSANFLGLSPLKDWANLKKVELCADRSGKAESATLKLTFAWFDSIQLKLNEINRTELAELLAATDEYAPSCKFDAKAVSLRLQLLEETKASALIETDKFSSTIFSPKQSGDFLDDNKYRVVRKLAGKALSAVYLARDNVNQERVVIKEYVLPSTAQHRERMLEIFEREYTILSTLKHPRIAQMKEMFKELDARYLVMEFVDGKDLRSIVERKGARNEKTVLRWALAITESMIFLHEQSPPVIHRDLTPDNLMEDSNGSIKLIDFGAAHQFMEGVTGTLIGKQCYIAPEQLRGRPNTRSDVYSFGCTLKFLLSARDPVALKQSDLTGQQGVSNNLVELIKDCTEFDDEKRPDSFQTIKTRLMAMSTPKKSLAIETAAPSIQPSQSKGEEK